MDNQRKAALKEAEKVAKQVTESALADECKVGEIFVIVIFLMQRLEYPRKVYVQRVQR